MNKQADEVIKGLEVCKTAPESIEECEGCPYNDGEEDCIARMAADALEMLKAKEPRVMTLEEAIKAVSKKGGLVWVEQKSHPLCDEHVFPLSSMDDCSSRKFKDYGKKFIPKKNSFRFMWRCWTSWPTEEQREAVKWDE